ncbi:hypothetical protein C8J56DRAFT_891644 [Mycena floridula]|nr:hypothetical protein C8J56DRAFT_891644 [Mycena floridula]
MIFSLFAIVTLAVSPVLAASTCPPDQPFAICCTSADPESCIPNARGCDADVYKTICCGLAQEPDGNPECYPISSNCGWEKPYQRCCDVGEEGLDNCFESETGECAGEELVDSCCDQPEFTLGQTQCSALPPPAQYWDSLNFTFASRTVVVPAGGVSNLVVLYSWDSFQFANPSDSSALRKPRPAKNPPESEYTELAANRADATFHALFRVNGSPPSRDWVQTYSISRDPVDRNKVRVKDNVELEGSRNSGATNAKAFASVSSCKPNESAKFLFVVHCGGQIPLTYSSFKACFPGP